MITEASELQYLHNSIQYMRETVCSIVSSFCKHSRYLIPLENSILWRFFFYLQWLVKAETLTLTFLRSNSNSSLINEMDSRMYQNSYPIGALSDMPRNCYYLRLLTLIGLFAVPNLFIATLQHPRFTFISVSLSLVEDPSCVTAFPGYSRKRQNPIVCWAHRHAYIADD